MNTTLDSRYRLSIPLLLLVTAACAPRAAATPTPATPTPATPTPARVSPTASSSAPAPAVPDAPTPEPPAPVADAPTPEPPAPVAANKKKPPRPCQGSALHEQFDFWLGTWTVKGPLGRVVGHNRISRKPGACALLESWHSISGGTGVSINYVHPVRKTWIQTWADSHGGLIELEGDLQNGAMVLVGTHTKADGTMQAMRGTWTPLADGRVQQRFEISKDQGATWTIWFDGFYTAIDTSPKVRPPVRSLD